MRPPFGLLNKIVRPKNAGGAIFCQRSAKEQGSGVVAFGFRSFFRERFFLTGSQKYVIINLEE